MNSLNRNNGSQTQVESFPGTGRRVDGSSDKLMTAPLTDAEKYVLDTHAPHAIPREKAVFSMRWDWHPKGPENTLDLGKIGVLDSVRKLKWGGSGAMVDSEIHIIYLPHLPVELYRNHQMEIVLDFDGTEDDERMLAKAVFPSPLHSHVIFYPGHSFSVKSGARYPWKINMVTSADVRSDYKIADVIIMLKGYNTPLSQYSEKNGADIISLVPASDVPTGITLTRPRGNGDWVVKNIHYGLKNKKDINAVASLQEAGIDIEGLQMMGRLKDAIKEVHKIQGSSVVDQLDTDVHQKIRNSIYPLVKNKKQTNA